jgi:hypothetical protein
MPGIGEVMEGAMQHAPQPVRQFIVGGQRWRHFALRKPGAEARVGTESPFPARTAWN